MTAGSLKQKTANALLWSLADRLGGQIIIFAVGILVANLLSVKDYALMGMLAIFTAISNLLLDSGFSTALIRKEEVSGKELSSVFWFNIFIGWLLYILLIGIAPLISLFFSQPQLLQLCLLVFLAIPINALSIVQTAILNRRIQFKTLAKINITSTLAGAVISFAMAFACMGVWALASQPVITAVVRSSLCWSHTRWRPGRVFSLDLIQAMWPFASGLLLANFINTVFLNIYSVIIGKVYPVRQLGYYTQANKMTDMGVGLIYSSIQNATLPILSRLQNEQERQVRAMRKTMRLTAMITLPVLLGMMVIAEPAIQLLLKTEWWPAIPMMQWLCIGGCFTVFTAINNNYIKVCGHSKILIKLEVLKVILTAIIIALTCRMGITMLIAGLVVTRILIWLAGMAFTARHAHYGFAMQLQDIMPYAILSVVMVLAVYPLDMLIRHNLLLLICQVLAGVLLYGSAAWLCGSRLMKEVLLLFAGHGVIND